MTIRRRSSRRLASLGLVLGVLVTLFAPQAASGAVTSISLDLQASGLDALTQVTSARDGSGRLFLVERRGNIRVFKGGAVQAGSFLDMRTMVEAGGERGLVEVPNDGTAKSLGEGSGAWLSASLADCRVLPVR